MGLKTAFAGLLAGVLFLGGTHDAKAEHEPGDSMSITAVCKDEDVTRNLMYLMADEEERYFATVYAKLLDMGACVTFKLFSTAKNYEALDTYKGHTLYSVNIADWIKGYVFVKEEEPHSLHRPTGANQDRPGDLINA